MNKKERLLLALGDINDKYVKEAEPNPMSGRKRILSIAASLAILLALSLYLFLPYGTPKATLSEYESSSYFPVIEKLEAYRQLLNAPKYSNNFEKLLSVIGGAFTHKGGAMAPGNNMDAAPPQSGPDGGNFGENGVAGNGNYIENTDNQVEGVIEGDLMKMTDKYIFRLGNNVLRVYSIEKEDSALVCEYTIDGFDGAKQYGSFMEMYLSPDGNTITLLLKYRDKVGVISLDVSDVNSIIEKGRVAIGGVHATSRMVDGRLLLVTNFSFDRNKMDYATPETFVPTINSGNEKRCISLQNLLFPAKVDSTNYSVVVLLDNENLEILGEKALLNFTSDIYISENNIYISHEYTDNDRNLYYKDMSDIAIISYGDDGLVMNKVITVPGHTKDQYSFDELDGHLRVVTSTNGRTTIENGNNIGFKRTSSASLYVINLESGETVASVENFAPEGEEATAVRFDGDKCYVCTAVVVSFTDPVFFFDLSDYDNITYTDTGIIEGYSDSLINYGDGILLGIGRENWSTAKVEIYTELEDGGVLSVDELKFAGTCSTDYKAYLVNRENNLFGFAVAGYSEVRKNDHIIRNPKDCYVLLTIEGESLNVRLIPLYFSDPNYVRAAYYDGYLYITTDEDLFVEKIN